MVFQRRHWKITEEKIKEKENIALEKKNYSNIKYSFTLFNVLWITLSFAYKQTGKSEAIAT